jgi:hypothetical protein
VAPPGNERWYQTHHSFYDVVWTGIQIPMFRRNTLPQPSGLPKQTEVAKSSKTLLPIYQFALRPIQRDRSFRQYYTYLRPMWRSDLHVTCQSLKLHVQIKYLLTVSNSTEGCVCLVTSITCNNNQTTVKFLISSLMETIRMSAGTWKLLVRIWNYRWWRCYICTFEPEGRGYCLTRLY